MKRITKQEVVQGYKEVIGLEEYVRLPKRAKEDLYKRYRAIERATIEYNRENQSKTKKNG